jgi:hypothetical protein
MGQLMIFILDRQMARAPVYSGGKPANPPLTPMGPGLLSIPGVSIPGVWLIQTCQEPMKFCLRLLSKISYPPGALGGMKLFFYPGEKATVNHA